VEQDEGGEEGYRPYSRRLLGLITPCFLYVRQIVTAFRISPFDGSGGYGLFSGI
jgi:hypothetical protein